MNLQGDLALALGYKSRSQIARVISEGWLSQNGYCLACSSDRLRPTRPNTRARDYVCDLCGHAYELKSTLGAFGPKVVDGAYRTMMDRIEASTTPSLLLLEYTSNWMISRLEAIHHTLITPIAIEARKPLSASAVRHGWVGCNILLSSIPHAGRITLCAGGHVVPKEQCREKFSQNETISALPPDVRNWTAAVLALIGTLGRESFTLTELYGYEDILQAIYPNNRHLRPKIRQQLQVLRDLGFVRFVQPGRYTLLLK